MEDSMIKEIFVGISYIISQVQDGVERIICYGSRKLTPAERKCHINKLELLAVVRCLEKNKLLFLFLIQ